MAKKSGKYAKVLGSLPALGIDPSRREAVGQVQEQIKAPLGTDEAQWRTAADIPLSRGASLRVADEHVQYIVRNMKRQTAGRPYAAEYARAYAECRATRDAIAEWDASFSLLVEAYMWLMVAQMEVEGTRALTLANGQPIRTFEKPQAKVDDPEAFRRWCLAPDDVCMACGEREAAPQHDVPREDDPQVHLYHPGGGLTNKLSLPWGTTNVLVEEMLLHGASEPDGVSVWKKTVVRLGAGE